MIGSCCRDPPLSPALQGGRRRRRRGRVGQPGRRRAWGTGWSEGGGSVRRRALGAGKQAGRLAGRQPGCTASAPASQPAGLRRHRRASGAPLFFAGGCARAGPVGRAWCRPTPHAPQAGPQHGPSARARDVAAGQAGGLARPAAAAAVRGARSGIQQRRRRAGGALCGKSAAAGRLGPVVPLLALHLCLGGCRSLAKPARAAAAPGEEAQASQQPDGCGKRWGADPA